MKILIVEDEKISRVYLSAIAKKYGDCDTAEDGESALKIIEKSFEENNRYDLIFLDIMLPKITGHRVLESIRNIELENEITGENKTIIIMTSALRDGENVKKAYKNLADGYIVKPIFKDKIEEILKKYKEKIKE